MCRAQREHVGPGARHAAWSLTSAPSSSCRHCVEFIIERRRSEQCATTARHAERQRSVRSKTLAALSSRCVGLLAHEAIGIDEESVEVEANGGRCVERRQLMVSDLEARLVAGVEDATDHGFIGTTGRDEEDVDDAPAAHPGSVALEASILHRSVPREDAAGPGRRSAQRDAAFEVATHRAREQRSQVIGRRGVHQRRQRDGSAASRRRSATDSPRPTVSMTSHICARLVPNRQGTLGANVP